MKKVLSFLVLFFVCTGLLIGSAVTPATAAKTITLKASMFFPYNPRNAEYKLYADWCKGMKERTNGRLKIQFVGGGEVIPWQDQIEAMRSGVIDMSWTIPASYKSEVPEALVFPVSTLTVEEERQAGVYEFLNSKHKPADLYLLSRLPCAGYVFYSNKKIDDPKKDFKGLKWGVTGTMWNCFCEALGIAPAFVPPPAKYSAMERGVIDGLGTSQTGAYALGFGEVSKYRIDHNFWPGCGAVTVMGLKSWEKIPKDLQDQLKEEHYQLEKDMYAIFPALIDKERENMVEKGVEIITFSPEDAEWYRNTAQKSKWAELKKLWSEDSYKTLRKMLGQKDL